MKHDVHTQVWTIKFTLQFFQMTESGEIDEFAEFDLFN